MKTINLYLTILVIALFATSCSNTITNKDDYAQFLNTAANTYLKQIEKDSGFDYYIRLAKWEDHNGNLDAAISNMEKAAAIAESSNLDGLKQWSYTNLADFYGHAGEIEKSYQHFLMALEIDPQDAYAKKGIAWILYSHENKPEEALAILEHCTTYYKSPDYELLKAEIADFIDNNDLKDQSIESYMAMSENPLYGDMYNSHTAMVFNDELSQPKNAIVLARDEVENRPTPASYDLLAWSYYNSGNTDLALQIIDEKVYGKTFEPAVLYHIAVIFKEVGRSNELDKLKQELIASSYELGPLTESKIRQL